MTPNFILMFPQKMIASEVMEEVTDITLTELCRACDMHANFILELIDEGAMDGISLQPGQDSDQWRFTGLHLHQAKIATRLQRDLGVNPAGAVLALQLIEEIARLRQQLHSNEASNHPRT